MERPTLCIFGRASPQKEGCTACIPRPSRKATDSHAALLACDIGEGCMGREKGMDGNAMCEEKIGGRCMPSVVLSWNYIV